MTTINRFQTISRLARNILLLSFLGFVVLALASCSSGDEAAQEETASEQLYTCGMHPQVIQNEPGNCPICGMKLTPLKTGAAAAQQHEPAEGEHAGMAEMAGMAGHSEMAQTATSTKQNSEMAMKSTDGQSAKKKDKKILYWRAPMDPTYIADKPGKSPMGMDLIPVYEGEAPTGGGSTITIDPNVVLNIGVKTSTVAVKKLRREIRSVAHVDYNEETLYRVNIKFSGWIEKLYVDETGQHVRKGEPMLEIYSPELLATQEEYLLAYKNAQKLRKSADEDVRQSGENLLRAARQRLLLWDISKKQIDALEKNGEARKTMTIFAPAKGIVLSKHVEEGMRVMQGMDLYRIADISKVWVYGQLYEYELPWVKVGDDVEMELPYVPGKTFSGKVKYIYPYLNKKTRDVKVRIEVPNPNFELKPDMYVNMIFSDVMPQETPVIPSQAVIRTGKRNLVFLALGEGKFEPREIVLGIEGENNEFQVLSGLKGGEQIVTSAQFLLDSESRLQEAIQKMLQSKLNKK